MDKLNQEDYETEEVEVETIETEMTNEDIDELIAKLHELKENKGSLNHELAEDTELIINYIEDSENDAEEDLE